MRSRDRALATLATLLQALLYSDTGRGDDAIKLLRGRANRSEDQLQEALLRMQLGMRYGEKREFQAAIRETNTAQALAQRSPKAWRLAIGTAAAHNIFAYRWNAESIMERPLELPAFTDSIALTRGSLLLADAFSPLLDESFERSLAEPYARSVRFRAVDPVEASLRGALMRAELLSIWNATRQSRQLLGRYLTLSRLGTPSGVPPGALELLRRAGDSKGLALTARTIWRLGPLPPLLLTVSTIVRRDFAQAEPAPLFSLLEAAADLLPAPEAGVALDQLMSERGEFLREWSTSIGAMAELTKSAPPQAQPVVATFAREILQTDSHAGVVQSLTRVIEAIRWAEVDSIERNAWLKLVRDRNHPNVDAVAPAVLHALAHVERRAVEALLRARLEEAVALDTIAVTIAALDPLPGWAAARAWPGLDEAMREIRYAAEQGQYGLGGLDVGRLAVAVLRTDLSNKRGWRNLVDFLLDPRVAVSAKTGALDALSWRDVQIPAEATRLLRSEIRTISGFDEPLGGFPEAFEGAVLRLAARVGGLTKDELLVRLLGLAGQPTTVGRVVAALALPALTPQVGIEVALTLGLSLTHDADPEVRGAAGAALTQIRGQMPPALKDAKRSRLQALLAEPGAIVPIRVLGGLGRGGPAARLDTQTTTLVAGLRDHHPSRAVREAAQAVSRTRQ
jgi:hypothetical protein